MIRELSQSQKLAFEGACSGCWKRQGTVGDMEKEVIIIIAGT
jgi:Fe-S cluster biogenesis protein NfuA